MTPKPTWLLYLEGFLYAVISGGAPWISFLDSDKPLTERTIIAVTVSSLVAAATAVKAYMSQKNA